MFASYHSAIFQAASYYMDLASQYVDLNYLDYTEAFQDGAIHTIGVIYGVSDKRVREDIRSAIDVMNED